ncbi:coil containing protein [Vibrio phage 1.101.O._10N.261.45.C6]|nr:coil containing protein [Vibrio phage 1.101.O._10N.261.45.C6]
MSKYSLDYAYTCPDLDGYIADAKSLIGDHFSDTLVELNPVLEGLENTIQFKEWVEQATLSLYSDLESIFEGCRKINEDIRSAADHQIAECVSELEDAQYRIQELENE